MTRSGLLQAVAIVGLTVASVSIGARTVAGPPPASGSDRSHLEVSSVDLTSGSRTTIISAHGMLPGDTVRQAITVANPGRQPLVYSMSRGPISAAGKGLAAALILTIKSVGSSCDDFDGLTLYSGPLSDANFGGQGDGRQIPAATAEILCVQALLPIETGNEIQGAATTVTLTFGSRASVR